MEGSTAKAIRSNPACSLGAKRIMKRVCHRPVADQRRSRCGISLRRKSLALDPTGWPHWTMTRLRRRHRSTSRRFRPRQRCQIHRCCRHSNRLSCPHRRLIQRRPSRLPRLRLRRPMRSRPQQSCRPNSRLRWPRLNPHLQPRRQNPIRDPRRGCRRSRTGPRPGMDVTTTRSAAPPPCWKPVATPRRGTVCARPRAHCAGLNAPRSAQSARCDRRSVRLFAASA